MSEVTIYHNPQCSKSRQTMAILEEKGIKPIVIEYLATPPDAQDLANILSMLGRSPRELMRTKEDAYKDNNLSDDSLTEDQLIQAMIDHPILIERPIVVSNGKAVLGRPPENVEELF